MKSSAHLKTLRQAAGLSQREAAAFCGNISLRTWKFWESTTTEQAIKPDVEQQLVELLKWQEHTIEATVQEILDLAKDLDSNRFTLTVYSDQNLFEFSKQDYPGGIGSHARVVRGVLTELILEGIDVAIVWDRDPGANVMMQ